MKQEKNQLQNKLKAFFEYCPKGFLIRKKQTTSKTKVGDVVGSNSHGGYKKFHFEGRLIYLHRAIFIWHFGDFVKTVDHIDRNPSNNKIENLRSVSHQENLCNLGVAKNNTSGFRGLYYDKELKKYYGQVVFKNKTHSTKRFKNKEHALNALENIRNKLYAKNK